MDEMTNLRRERFRQLLNGPLFKGDRALLMRETGLSKGRVTQLLDPKQGFGELAGINLAKKLAAKHRQFRDSRWFEKSDPGGLELKSPDGMQHLSQEEKRPVTHADDRASMQTHEVDEGDTSDANQKIPTEMKYTAPNLRSAIMLMGNLLGALDESSREIVGDILLKVARHSTDPSKVKDYAEKAATLATVQAPITDNAALNKALRGRKDAVETGHSHL